MPLSSEIIADIEDKIRTIVRTKLTKYRRETEAMPFHDLLLGRDRVVLYSFAHSVSTTMGMSLYEYIARVIAQPRYPIIERQFSLGKKLSRDAQSVIQEIVNELSQGKAPHKTREIERIRAVCQSGDEKTLTTINADLMLQDEQGVVYCFDLKTAKPNKSDFIKLKRLLLEWTALYLYKHPQAEIHTCIAIPYNPYEPQPYNRWTIEASLELPEELRVADEFWDFIGGAGAYQDILGCFERIGLELKPELDAFFDKLPSINSQDTFQPQAPDTLDFGEANDAE